MEPAAKPKARRKAPAASERDRLIEDHKHLCDISAGWYFKRNKVAHGMTKDDLIAAGNLGLVKAAEQFDPSRGVKFATFAITLIRGAIFEAVRDADYLSRHHRDEVKAGVCADPRPISIDAHVYADESCTTTRTIANKIADTSPGPEAQAMESDLKSTLRRLMGKLKEREEHVVRRHYFDDWTFAAIGEELGVSESRACQLNQQALIRLRVLMIAEGRDETQC